MSSRADVVVCGAGIAGVAAAYHLKVVLGVERVVICDPRPPLTLTSDRSTECYRNWWPNAPMVGLMNRSIDLLDAWAGRSGNAFGMNRRGYLYATADPRLAATWEQSARDVSALGAGPLRIHRAGDTGYQPSGGSDGADLILDRSLVRSHFPYLTENTVAVLHARRAGWLSAQQLGRWMLESAADCGLVLVPRRVTGVTVRDRRLDSVTLDDGETIRTGSFVNAAGPLVGEVAALVGEDLPVTSELHLKAIFKEHRRIVPADAPLLIWSDRHALEWSPEVREMLGADPDTRYLLDELPAACHGRPEGGPDSPYVLALWEYHRKVMEPVWPVPLDPMYPELVMRGMSTMIPGLDAYRDGLPRAAIDGGYYTKTVENLPLIGPLTTAGVFVVGALSGFGIMAAAAAGELIALHATGQPLPAYAPAFLPSRYEDPAYVQSLPQMLGDGQL